MSGPLEDSIKPWTAKRKSALAKENLFRPSVKGREVRYIAPHYCLQIRDGANPAPELKQYHRSL